MYKCFDSYGIDTEYLKCNLKYDKYYKFRDEKAMKLVIRYINVPN